MSKLLATLVLTTLCAGVHAQSLPADVAAAYQQQADERYAVEMKSCAVMGEFPWMRNSCEDAAARSKATYLLQASALYWSVTVRNDRKRDFNDVAAGCRKTHSDDCLSRMQDAAEDYVKADVDVLRAQ